jgi:hypothetical protein
MERFIGNMSSEERAKYVLSALDHNATLVIQQAIDDAVMRATRLENVDEHLTPESYHALHILSQTGLVYDLMTGDVFPRGKDELTLISPKHLRALVKLGFAEFHELQDGTLLQCRILETGKQHLANTKYRWKLFDYGARFGKDEPVSAQRTATPLTVRLAIAHICYEAVAAALMDMGCRVNRTWEQSADAKQFMDEQIKRSDQGEALDVIRISPDGQDNAAIQWVCHGLINAITERLRNSPFDALVYVAVASKE